MTTATQNDATAKVDAFLARRHQLFIDGKWVDPIDGETFAVHDPALGEEIAQVALGKAADVDKAVAAASKAFETGPWPAMTPSERARILLRVADLIEKYGDELALLETRNQGKLLAVSKMAEVGGSAEQFRYMAGWATKLGGESVPMNGPGNWHAYTLREPIGVVGAITPWNFPLSMASQKIAPALAVGCTVVLKPAENTPMTALRLAEILQEAGVPDGVVNVVTGFGSDAGSALTEHPKVDKITFTGSTAVGKTIIHAATGNLKKLSLELGGKSPVFVFGDADIEQAVQAVAGGIFFNSGQVCAAGSRLYVHASIYDRMVQEVAKVAEGMKVGPGIDPASQLGPLVSAKQQSNVLSMIEEGRHGADLVTGGKAVGDKGYYVAPTIIANADPKSKIMQDEVFGPVLCATRFDTDDLDVLAAEANDSIYGLFANIWTRDVSVAHRFARKIKSGTVRVNATVGLDNALPFGGYKQSGWGRESGRVGIEEFTQIKSVAVQL
jgi:phenylacetaldehyde dehydrogenase